MLAKTRRVALALFVTVVAAIFAAVSWMSATDRMASVLSQPQPSHFGGESAVKAAFGYLAAKKPDAALTYARQAVRTAPIDPASTSALASTELALGKSKTAYDAFAVAANFGWRDIPTQLYWLAQALTVGDVSVASSRLDALLRLDVDNDAATTAIHILGQTRAGQSAFASLLAKNPPWENRVLRATATLTDDAFAGRMAAIDMAASKGVQLDCTAIGIAANQLLTKGRIDDAKHLWRQACDRNADVYLSDGSFETDLTKAQSNPFDWRLQSTAGLDVSVQTAPIPLTGRALRIDSSMTVRTVAARQLTALRPGGYRMSWQTARDSDDKPDSSIDVLIRCNGTSPLDLSSASPPTAQANTTARTFTIPETECAIQGIEIQKAASIGGNSSVGWIDNMHISPVS